MGLLSRPRMASEAPVSGIPHVRPPMLHREHTTVKEAQLLTESVEMPGDGACLVCIGFFLLIVVFLVCVVGWFNCWFFLCIWCLFVENMGLYRIQWRLLDMCLSVAPSKVAECVYDRCIYTELCVSFEQLRRSSTAHRRCTSECGVTPSSIYVCTDFL